MGPDPFASGTLPTILSWLSAGPILLGLLAGVFSAVFTPATTRVKMLSAWFVVCALALTPVRYMLFQIVAAACYPWQSIRAFLSTFILAIYVPIVFGLLCALAIGAPLLAAILVAGNLEKPRISRAFASAVVFPLLCLVGSSVYYNFAFPFAARSVYWLHPVDVLRAVNGPAYVTFKYIAMPFTPMSFPIPAEQLSGSDLDLMRLHVVSAYMNGRNEAWVLKEAYPKLFDQLYERRSRSLSNFAVRRAGARVARSGR